MQGLLIVGGTDPSGGAGISQDVLHAHDVGIWACPVVSAVTVQTPDRFDEAAAVPPTRFVAALEAAGSTVDIAGVKIGYLATPAQVEYLAAYLRSLRMERPDLPIVIDPVGIPTAGQHAPERHAVLQAVADKLVTLATLITPNVAELALLSGHPTGDALETEVAAKRLNILGAKGVLVKTAETAADHVTDRYITKYENNAIKVPRSPIEEVHGSGCALATRVTGYLVRGMSGEDAARTAVQDVATLRQRARYGKRHSQALFSPQPLSAGPDADEAVRHLERVVPRILRCLPAEWIAECGNNIAYAAAGVTEEDQVAVLRQRIRLLDGRPEAASVCTRRSRSHVARIALAAATTWGSTAAAMNLRNDPTVLDAAEAAGLSAAAFDRSAEPTVDASGSEWGTRTVLAKGSVDLVYDGGGQGKEPMIRLLAEDPDTLHEKLDALVTAHVRGGGRIVA